MNLTDIIQIIQDNNFIQGILVLILCFIKIPKIQLNVWGVIGKSLNKDLSKKINELDVRVKTLHNNFELNVANNCRQRILRFNNEILSGTTHTKEFYDEILIDIDKYENYCRNHPEYPNNKAVLSIKNIKRNYQELQENNSR